MPYADPENKRAYNKAYRELNKERLRLQDKINHAKNYDKKKNLEQAHRYRRDHPEKYYAYQAAYRMANREKRRQQNLAYYYANKEIILEKEKSYRRRHKQEIRLYHQIYNTKNKEKVRARRIRYYLENKEKHQAYYKVYTKEKSHIYLASGQKRRAQKMGSARNDFSAAQWKAMQEHYDHRCVYCKKRYKGKLTQDHITPLSRGGNHTASNIVPACKSCNSKKHTGPVLTPVQPLLVL